MATKRNSVGAAACVGSAQRIKCKNCQIKVLSGMIFAGTWQPLLQCVGRLSSLNHKTLLQQNASSPGRWMSSILVILIDNQSLLCWKNTWTLVCSMSSPQVKTLCAGLDLLMQRSAWNKILQRTASFNFPTFRRLAWQRGQQRPVQLRVHMEVRSKGLWSQSLLARVECWHTNTWFWLYFQN